MAGIHDFWCFEDDFIGGGTFVASAGLDPWVITDTSSSGTPTYARVDLGETTGAFRPGVAKLTFDSTSEVQNICLSFGDKLAFDFDKIKGYECGLRFVEGTGSHKDTATTVAWGLTGDRNDAIASITYAALFRLLSSSAVEDVSCEIDDNVNDTTAVSSMSLTVSQWAKFSIDFSNKSDVKFFGGLASAGLKRLNPSTTYNMENYHAGMQPFFQLQKTADTTVDSLEIDYVRVWGVR